MTTHSPTEAAFIEGHRRAMVELLRHVLHELHLDNAGENMEAQLAEYVKERTDALIQLRRLCARLGDNEWPDSLYLGDIIEKHVEPCIDFEDDDAVVFMPDLDPAGAAFMREQGVVDSEVPHKKAGPLVMSAMVGDYLGPEDLDGLRAEVLRLRLIANKLTEEGTQARLERDRAVENETQALLALGTARREGEERVIALFQNKYCKGCRGAEEVGGVTCSYCKGTGRKIDQIRIALDAGETML